MGVYKIIWSTFFFSFETCKGYALEIYDYVYILKKTVSLDNTKHQSSLKINKYLGIFGGIGKWGGGPNNKVFLFKKIF